MYDMLTNNLQSSYGFSLTKNHFLQTFNGQIFLFKRTSVRVYSMVLSRFMSYGPFTQETLINLVELSSINLKIFQHEINIMFPHAEFPLDIVQKKYPNIKFQTNIDKLSWNDLTTTYYPAYIQRQKHFTFFRVLICACASVTNRSSHQSRGCRL